MNVRSARTGLRFGISGVLALILAMGLVAPAEASKTTRKDGRNDPLTGQASSMIDLARVQLRTKKRKRLIQATVRLHTPVAATRLSQPGGMAVEFRRNKRIIRSIRIYTVNGKLRGDVCSFDTRKQLPPPRKCRKVKVKQLNAKTYRAVVKRKQIKKGAKVLRWFASSLQMGGTPTVDIMRPGKKPNATYRWKL